MPNPGDHICAIYSSKDELADIVADFLAEGLRKSERCWYLPAGDDPEIVRARLAKRRVDVRRATERGALHLLPPEAVYGADGGFDPEETMAVFSGAIEQALTDGFNGFRAAANMSWALALDNGVERLMTYEALLKSLFAGAPATGLCLYDHARMPLAVIDGALCTHPMIHSAGAWRGNPFYDERVRGLRDASPSAVQAALGQLGLVPGSRE